MTLTLSELLLATKTRRPSGLTATPRGRLPTAMVLTTARVVASITVTSSDFSLVTNTRTSALASAGRVSRTSRTSRTSVPSNRDSIGVLSGAPSGWSAVPRFPYLSSDRQGRLPGSEHLVREQQERCPVRHAAVERGGDAARPGVVERLEDDDEGARTRRLGETQALRKWDGVVVGAVGDEQTRAETWHDGDRRQSSQLSARDR